MSNVKGNQDREFYCFISYKHRDGEKFKLDEDWAEALAFSLTQLHIPAETKPPIDEEAFINLNPKDDVVYPVFRDYEVLKAGEKFSERIVAALKHSKKLVLIVSDEMIVDQEKLVNSKSSVDKEERYLNAWCYREVFCFLQNHLLEDIIPVYIGSITDINDIPLPSVLTGGLRKRDYKANKLLPNQKSEYEGYIKYWKSRILKNADLKGEKEINKELRDTLAASIAANIFGTDADQFRNYQMAEEEKRQAEKKKNLIQKIFGAVIAIIAISVLFVSRQVNSSQVNLSKARISLSEGNRKDAMSYALSAYKKWRCTPDLTQLMWNTLEPKESFMAFDSEVAVSQARNEFAVMRENQYVDVYDGNSLRVVATYDIGHGGALVYSPNGVKLAVYAGKEISIIDRETASIAYARITFFSSDDIKFSPDGEYVFLRNWGLCRTTDFKKVVTPQLPFHSYSTKNSFVSFLGSNDKLAYIDQINYISGKSPSETLWTISVFDLSKQDSLPECRHGDFYCELPDSVSFVQAYNSIPVFYTTSGRGVSFFRFDEKGLTNIGWSRFRPPLNAGSFEKWPNTPYEIEHITPRPGVDGFVLHSNRGVSFGLDSRGRLSTVVAANVYQNGDISTYRGEVLAVGDSLNLVADKYGHLFLFSRVNPDNHGDLASNGAIPLSGLTHEEGRTYSILKLGDYQFVSQSHEVVSGKQTRTLMFWNRDTREIPTLVQTDIGVSRYTSPNLRFSIVHTDKEMGVFDAREKVFIPVCSTSIWSSKQDSPMYVSEQGDDVYVLAAKHVPDHKPKIMFDLVQVNLPSKTTSVLVEDMDDFSRISEGVILGQSYERSVIIDLRRKFHIAEYSGWLDISNEHGLYSVTRRDRFSDQSWYTYRQPLLYDSVTASLVPAPDSTGKYYSSSLGGFCVRETIVDHTIEYELSDLHSLNHIVTIVAGNGVGGIAGITGNDRYFIYADTSLSIYDLKTNKGIETSYSINSPIRSKLTLADDYLFLPSNVYRIIELKSGKTVLTIPEIQSDNQQVCFSPNEKWMLAGQYLINIDEAKIVSNSIPYGYNRILSNENILYMNKRFALPKKKALVKQISEILNDELR